MTETNHCLDSIAVGCICKNMNLSKYPQSGYYTAINNWIPSKSTISYHLNEWRETNEKNIKLIHNKWNELRWK